jgi:hypothetical protein
MTTIFDFLNDINSSKKNILTSDNEVKYIPYVVDKGLSLFIDTLFYANQMNMCQGFDKKLHYEYLLNSIRSKKRFSKWPKKKEIDENTKFISKIYNVNYQKASMIIKRLTEDQLNIIKEKYENIG